MVKYLLGDSDGKESTCSVRRGGIKVPSLSRKDLLEKGMAMHSSILAREFHRQRSLVGYSSVGCKELDLSMTANPNDKGGKTSQAF